VAGIGTSGAVLEVQRARRGDALKANSALKAMIGCPADDARSESFFAEKAPKNGASRNVHLHVE
jgi:hypothetical protein